MERGFQSAPVEELPPGNLPIVTKGIRGTASRNHVKQEQPYLLKARRSVFSSVAQASAKGTISAGHQRQGAWFVTPVDPCSQPSDDGA